MNTIDLVALEELVDRWTLGGLLNGLATICAEKAEHVRSNWQDDEMADQWSRDGGRIARTAYRVEG